MRKASELPAQPQASTAAANRENLSFPFDRGVFKTEIKASSPERITQTPFFIRAQDNKRDRSCLNRSQLGHGDLPRAQHLQQQGFDVVIDFVELIDQKYARPMLITQRAQQGTFGKEVQRVQPVAVLTPVFMEVVGLRFQKEIVQCLVESANELLFRNSHVALYPL